MPQSRALKLRTESDTRAFGRRLAPHLRGGDLVILSGPLGAGKTFLARVLCHALGLADDEPVQSPTFTLVREYDTTPPICHADVYRLTTAGDVLGLDLDRERSRGKLILCEWGEPYVEILGGDALIVDLTTEPRSVALRATGPRGEAVLDALDGDLVAGVD